MARFSAHFGELEADSAVLLVGEGEFIEGEEQVGHPAVFAERGDGAFGEAGHPPVLQAGAALAAQRRHFQHDPIPEQVGERQAGARELDQLGQQEDRKVLQKQDLLVLPRNAGRHRQNHHCWGQEVHPLEEPASQGNQCPQNRKNDMNNPSPSKLLL